MTTKSCPKVAKMNPKANQNDQHGAKREPKGSQSKPRNFQKHQLRNRFEKIEVLTVSRDKKRKPFLSKSIKKSYPKSFPKTITTEHGT